MIGVSVSKTVHQYRRTLSVLLLLVLALLLAFPITPVYAIADPDSPPVINAAYVYEDLLETGDAGVLVDYFLDYAALPTETVTEAYIVAFLGTDGSTQLGAVSPYAFQDSPDEGYGHDLAWIYFSAADVTTYSISSASMALYSVRLVGNPALTWAGDLPSVTAALTYWQPSGSSTAVLLAQRIVSLAADLEADWTLDMVEATTLGNKLTATYGADYISNVIFDARPMAPAAFGASTVAPVQENISYDAVFGATMTNGTGSVNGSPITLASGSTTVTVTVAGTFTLELNQGVIGTVTDGTGAVTGSPVALVAGTNTITVPAGGTGDLTVYVALSTTQTALVTEITGTGFDLSAPASAFGMSTMVFSGLVWFGLTIVICAKSVKYVGTKSVTMLFVILTMGGAVLVFTPVLVAALMFIGFGVLTAYVIFFRGSSI